ncbi:MAG: hypothetical protein ACYDH5_15490 [Acidimicrobiales bacterium]
MPSRAKPPPGNQARDNRSASPADRGRPPGNFFTAGAIVCGLLAVALPPVVFGVAGIALATVAKLRRERRANLAFVVVGLGVLTSIALVIVLSGTAR